MVPLPLTVPPSNTSPSACVFLGGGGVRRGGVGDKCGGGVGVKKSCAHTTKNNGRKTRGENWGEKVTCALQPTLATPMNNPPPIQHPNTTPTVNTPHKQHTLNTGRDSPVSILSSTYELPRDTCPSAGTLAPGSTLSTSPLCMRCVSMTVSPMG